MFIEMFFGTILFVTVLVIQPSEDEASDDDCYGWIPIGFRIRGLID